MMMTIQGSSPPPPPRDTATIFDDLDGEFYLAFKNEDCATACTRKGLSCVRENNWAAYTTDVDTFNLQYQLAMDNSPEELEESGLDVEKLCKKLKKKNKLSKNFPAIKSKANKGKPPDCEIYADPDEFTCNNENKGRHLVCLCSESSGINDDDNDQTVDAASGMQVSIFALFAAVAVAARLL